MFMGEYNHTIDSKGRLIIPLKFRAQLGEKFVITRGDDGCLALYTKEAWETFLGKIKLLPNKKITRQYVREYVSTAEEMETDKQGRILVPQSLRNHAGLTKDVVLAGVIDKIEIWDKAKWDEESTCDDIEDISEQMAELGLNF